MYSSTNKLLLLATLTVTLITHARAQGLTVGLEGGLQGMHYTMRPGADKLLPGGSLDLLYAFHLKGPLNLITGLTAGIYRTRATLPDGVVFSKYEVDDEGSAFQYSMKTEAYKETQTYFAAGLPLLLQYHSAGARAQWYLNAGGKILLPSAASVAVSTRKATFSGYYPDYNIAVSDLPQHGFGSINNWKATTTVDLRPSTALTAAAGLSYPLNHGMRIYTGVYVDYGLTTLKGKNGSVPLITYSPTGVNGVKDNSVINLPTTGRPSWIAAGLQVRLTLEKPTSRPSGARHIPPPVKAAPSAPVDITLSDDDTAFLQKSVTFGVMDETAIPAEDQEHLDGVADMLKQHPKIRLSLIGHICNSETEKEDPKVGLMRAKAVAAYLQAKGIDRKRMDIHSVNVSDPVEPNHPAANYQKRRVVIMME